MKKDISWNGNKQQQQKSWGSNTYTRQNRLLKKIITRDNEGTSNSTSGYLSEETQNTKSKRHIHP